MTAAPIEKREKYVRVKNKIVKAIYDAGGRVMAGSDTLEKGKRADLVLPDANPLKDIANTQRRTGLMLKGKYYQQTEMNAWLDQIAPRFQHALDEQK